MAEIQVIAIRKDNGNHSNPNEAITDFKWVNHANNKTGESTRIAMVGYIEDGNKAYVSNGVGRAYCYVRDNGNIKFLQTASDGYYNNNLLSLPEF